MDPAPGQPRPAFPPAHLAAMRLSSSPPRGQQQPSSFGSVDWLSQSSCSGLTPTPRPADVSPASLPGPGREPPQAISIKEAATSSDLPAPERTVAGRSGRGVPSSPGGDGSRGEARSPVAELPAVRGGRGQGRGRFQEGRRRPCLRLTGAQLPSKPDGDFLSVSPRWAPLPPLAPRSSAVSLSPTAAWCRGTVQGVPVRTSLPRFRALTETQLGRGHLCPWCSSPATMGPSSGDPTICQPPPAPSKAGACSASRLKLIPGHLEHSCLVKSLQVCCRGGGDPVPAETLKFGLWPRDALLSAENKGSPRLCFSLCDIVAALRLKVVLGQKWG